ncbi:hypothetical protein [Sphingomonas sp.]|uniref:hypothetical protein n=1 Tax=Sphingomonas sp. TaxID=28214 RepID=UPI003AFFEDDA
MTQRNRKIRTWASGLPRRVDEYDFDRPLRRYFSRLAGADRLPIVHVTHVHAARRIVETAKLTTKLCEVFAKSLAYFFVLKPAYLGKFDREKSDFLDYFPVAFILKPEAVPAPYHVYPFDTGGAATGAFKARANRLVPLEDYELETSHEAAVGFIGWAFGSTAAYYDGMLRHHLSTELSPADSVATGYVAIARLGVPGDPEHDMRAATLELASADAIDLAGNVLLTIIPKQLLESQDRFGQALDALKATGAMIETYDWQPNRAPAEFQRDLLRLARVWYAENGLDV